MRMLILRWEWDNSRCKNNCEKIKSAHSDSDSDTVKLKVPYFATFGLFVAKVYWYAIRTQN